MLLPNGLKLEVGGRAKWTVANISGGGLVLEINKALQQALIQGYTTININFNYIVETLPAKVAIDK